MEAVGHQWLLQSYPVEKLHLLKHPVHNTDMEVHMPVQGRAEPLDESDGTNAQGRLVHACHTGAVGLQILRDDPKEDAQHHVPIYPVALQKIAQSLWHRQHPLAHRQAGKDVIRQVRRRLHHAPAVAQGAHPPILVGEGHKVVVTAIIAAGAGKHVGKDAAFEVFTECLADLGLGGVVVALPVELARTGQFKPGLEVFDNGLVEQHAL